MRLKQIRWWISTGIAICVILISGKDIGWTQVREVWLTRYEGVTTFATALTLDSQNNVYVTGYALGYTTVKYDTQTGQELWVANYAHRPLTGSPQAIAADLQNNVIVTGSSPNLGNGAAYATVKYDEQTGQELWAARFNGSANGNDQANGIVVDSQNDIYITGGSYYTGTGQDYTTIKYHGQTGQPLWVARYNGSLNGSDQAFGMTVDAENNVYVTGSSFGTGTGTDYITIKYNGQTGQQLWIARYNQTINDAARAITLDRQGSVIVTGDVGLGYVTIKYNAQTGQPVWADYVALPGSGAFAPVAVSVKADSSGDIFVIGRFNQSGSERRSLILKYNGQTGHLLWSQTFPSGFRSLALDQDGHAYVCGAGYGPNGDVPDFRVAKYDGQTGGLLWTLTRSV